MFCKQCGNKLNDGDTFCASCGAKVSLGEQIFENVNNVLKNELNKSGLINTNTINGNNVCPKCGATLDSSWTFCGECGAKIEKKVMATKEDIYVYPIKTIIKKKIDDEVVKIGLDKNKSIKDIENRKVIFTIIFSILNIIFLSFYFFHLGTLYYLLIPINLIIYFMIIKSYTVDKYLYKQVSSRKDEDISNIVASCMMNTTNSKKYLIITIMVLSFILTGIIYFKPHIMYENYNDGVRIRFYTIGIINDKDIVIPEEYNGKKVIAIRGNTFSNISSIKSISLPNTITEINGQAFMGDTNLESINIPTSLTYLGGSAFENCTSLKSITLPDGLTVIHGDTFYNASSLESINIPDAVTKISAHAFEGATSLKNVTISENSKLTEIGSSAFRENTSLEYIYIPDSVKTINDRAFRGDTSLSKVEISENSKLSSIGESAFRECISLDKIVIPKNTTVGNKAFKDSGTTIVRYGTEEAKYASIDFGSLIDTTNYKYKVNHFINLNENTYVTSNECNVTGAVIYLLNIEKDPINTGYYIYSLEYVLNDEIKYITLSVDGSYSYINEDIAVEVSDIKYLGTDDRINLNIYYN